jgi:hypothetical protein
MARTGKPAVRQVAAVERAIAVLETLAEGELAVAALENSRKEHVGEIRI